MTREVTLDAEMVGLINDPWGNRRAGFSSEAAFSRADFGLTWTVALEAGSWLVGDQVKIVVDCEAIKEAAVSAR